MRHTHFFVCLTSSFPQPEKRETKGPFLFVYVCVKGGRVLEGTDIPFQAMLMGVTLDIYQRRHQARQGSHYRVSTSAEHAVLFPAGN